MAKLNESIVKDRNAVNLKESAYWRKRDTENMQ